MPKNWAVLSGSVVVGRIVESAAYSSRLQLVTDKGFLAVGQIQRVIDGRDVQIGPKLVKLSPQNATMVPVRFKGDGKGAVLIESVKRSHNIRVGDRLVTSPANPLLPMTAMVGKVTRVAEHKDPNWVTLEVQPGVDLAAIREVMVIQPRVAPPAVKGGE